MSDPSERATVYPARAILQAILVAAVSLAVVSFVVIDSSSGPIPGSTSGSTTESTVSCDLYAAGTGSDSSGDGSIGSPFRSVGEALDQAARQATGQRTVCLRTGTYGDRRTNTLIESGETTVASAPGERARIVGRLEIDGDNVTVSNLDLQVAYGDRSAVGLSVLGDHATLENNDITRLGGDICIHLGSTDGFRPRGTVIANNRIHACGRLPRRNQDHGIYVGSALDTRIRDNLIYDNADRGLQLWPDGQGTIIDGNIFDGNGQGVNIAGDGAHASGDNSVEHNVIANSIGSVAGDLNSPGWNLMSNWEGGTPPPGNSASSNCLYADNANAFYNTDGGVDTSQGGIALPASGPDANLILPAASGLELYAGRGSADFHLVGRQGAGNDCLERAGVDSDAASSAAGWSAPSVVGSGREDLRDPSVAVGADGTSVAVWRQLDDTSGRWQVQSASRSARAGSYPGPELTWERPVALSDPGGNTSDVRVGVDDLGNAIATWRRFDGSHWNVQASVRAGASDAWGPVETLYGGNGDADRPALAVADDGIAYAIWAVRDAGEYFVRSRRYDGSGWEPAADLYAGTGRPLDPQVAAGDRDNAIVTWMLSAGGGRRLQARVRGAGGAWAPETILADSDAGAGGMSISMNGTGNAVVGWYSGRAGARGVHARVENSGSWGASETLSDASGDAVDPQVAIDRAGRVVAVWRQLDGADWRIRANRYESGSWHDPGTISGGDREAFSPSLAASGPGQATAVWTQSDPVSGNLRAESAALGLDGGWGPPESISVDVPGAISREAAVSMPDAGRAVALWLQTEGPSHSSRVFATDRLFK